MAAESLQASASRRKPFAASIMAAAVQRSVGVAPLNVEKARRASSLLGFFQVNQFLITN